VIAAIDFTRPNILSFSLNYSPTRAVSSHSLFPLGTEVRTVSRQDAFAVPGIAPRVPQLFATGTALEIPGALL